MSTLGIIIVVAMMGSAALFLIACCKVAGDADDSADQFERDFFGDNS